MARTTSVDVERRIAIGFGGRSKYFSPHCPCRGGVLQRGLNGQLWATSCNMGKWAEWAKWANGPKKNALTRPVKVERQTADMPMSLETNNKPPYTVPPEHGHNCGRLHGIHVYSAYIQYTMLCASIVATIEAHLICNNHWCVCYTHQWIRHFHRKARLNWACVSLLAAYIFRCQFSKL